MIGTLAQTENILLFPVLGNGEDRSRAASGQFEFAEWVSD